MYNSTALPSIKALPVLAACCFSAPAFAYEAPSTLRQPVEMFQSSQGTAALAANMRKTGVFMLPDGHLRMASPVRDTTDQERVIAQLRAYVSLQANWDGEGAEAPNSESAHAAADFACLLSASAAIPESMLHASGRSALAWSWKDGSYGELEFYPDGKVAYYFTNNQDKHKGFVYFDRVEIPRSIKALIPTVDDAV